MRKHLTAASRVTALAVLLWLLPGTATAAPILYGITFGEQLISIDTATGAGTLVGNLSSSMAAFGLGVKNGKLYTYDQTADLLRELDPATAATVNSTDLGLGNLFGEGGLGFRSDGVGYLNSTSGPSSTFYTFDTTPGSGALVGNTGGVSGIDGLAFSSTDVLFALGQSNGNLYTVNQATGALTLVGPTGVAGEGLGGLDFLGSVLFAAFSNGNLYTVDTTTGAATLIGATGFSNISGLAVLDQVAVPEPALIVLLGTGVAFFVRRRVQR